MSSDSNCPIMFKTDLQLQKWCTCKHVWRYLSGWFYYRFFKQRLLLCWGSSWVGYFTVCSSSADLEV